MLLCWDFFGPRAHFSNPHTQADNLSQAAAMSRRAVIRKPGPKGTFLLQDSSLGERRKLFLGFNFFSQLPGSYPATEKKCYYVFCLDLAVLEEEWIKPGPKGKGGWGGQ